VEREIVKEKFWDKWILTNYAGAYSISTLSLTNTSRWDSLLSILRKKRYNLLGKLWDIAKINGKEYHLDTSDFGDVIHPDGFNYISQTKLERGYQIYYDLHGTQLIKEIYLDKKREFISIKYSAIGDSEVELNVVPLLQMRVAEELNKDKNANITVRKGDFVEISRGDLVIISNQAENFIPSNDTYFKFYYLEDDLNGYDSVENLYSPGYFQFKLNKEINIDFWVPGNTPQKDFSNLMGRPKGINQDIWNGADLFITQDNIIAGFPWFNYWSRDAFISIPGLLLVRGYLEHGKIIIENWMNLYPDGKIPNMIGGEIYPSDSPLWFIYSLKKYFDYTNDTGFIYRALDYTKHILDNYIEGYEGIKLDGYFIHSPPGRTWMDAQCDGKFITPREGKPIEVNSLWYNALKIFKEFMAKTNTKIPEEYDNLIAGFEENFQKKFVKGNKIKDIADPDDFSVRPNFLFAFSLPYNLLSNIRPFNALLGKLATPYGLRSLSSDDPRYIGIYAGSKCERDMAYHNGTVWPWLVGPYITALVRNNMDRNQLLSYFSPLLNLKYLPEIFDGNLPSIPRGAYAQAWSYAEILRALREDLKI